jgi:hypothetical protein
LFFQRSGGMKMMTSIYKLLLLSVQVVSDNIVNKGETVLRNNDQAISDGVTVEPIKAG